MECRDRRPRGPLLEGPRPETSSREQAPTSRGESFRKSLQAYEAAMDIDGVKVDFYMADNVGQLSLTLGDIPAAKEAYERARVALENVTARD